MFPPVIINIIIIIVVVVVVVVVVVIVYLPCNPLPYKGFLYLGMHNGAIDKHEHVIAELLTTCNEYTGHTHMYMYCTCTCI